MLRDALGVRRGERVSLIGAGSETTTMPRAAKELRNRGSKGRGIATAPIVKPTKSHVDRMFLFRDVLLELSVDRTQ